MYVYKIHICIVNVCIHSAVCLQVAIANGDDKCSNSSLMHHVYTYIYIYVYAYMCRYIHTCINVFT